jgi:hypothetical protein
MATDQATAGEISRPIEAVSEQLALPRLMTLARQAVPGLLMGIVAPVAVSHAAPVTRHERVRRSFVRLTVMWALVLLFNAALSIGSGTTTRIAVAPQGSADPSPGRGAR